jgi:hypothetical protein
MSKYFCVVSIILCCCSCTNESENNFEFYAVGDDIIINPSETNEIRYSQLFNSVNYIRIPTDSNFLIGNIDKLLITENHVLIMDKYISRSVFIFDKAGKNKIQLYKQGRGPGEYIAMQDIYFNSTTQELSIYCNMRKKMLYYDLTGKFIREKPITYNAGRVIPVGENYAVFCEYRLNEKFKKERQYPNLLLSTKTDSLISSTCFFSNVDVSIVWSSLPDFSQWNKKIAAIKPDHCNIVYHVTEDSIYPAYHLDFGKYSLDTRYWKKTKEYGTSVEKVDDYCNRLGFCESYNFLEDSDYLYFNYKQNKKIHFAFYSLKTKKLVNAHKLTNDMDQITLFYPKFFQDKKFYCLLSSEDIIMAKKYLAQNQLIPTHILDNVEEFDNPVIVVFSLKDF